MLELPEGILRLPALPATALAALGLVIAFFGRTLWKVAAFVLGAVAGGGAGYVAASLVAPGSGVCALAALALGALLGGALALALMKGALALAFGALVSGLVAAVTSSAAVALAALLIGFAVAWILMDGLMAAVTAVAGGALVGLGAGGLLEGGSGPLAALGVAVLVSVAGLLFQLRSHRGDPGAPGRENG
ncbi:MAG: hypothetical protein ACUVV6_01775 [Thermoplasmatota archaeon]